MFGSGNAYGHRYILDRDIVFVSMNYRLGPLGEDILKHINNQYNKI